MTSTYWSLKQFPRGTYTLPRYSERNALIASDSRIICQKMRLYMFPNLKNTFKKYSIKSKTQKKNSRSQLSVSSELQRLSMSVVKLKSNLSHTPNKKNTENLGSQSKIAWNMYSRHEARENTVASGFGFTSDWLRKWREFFKPITKRSNAKPKKTWITFEYRTLVSENCSSSKQSNTQTRKKKKRLRRRRGFGARVLPRISLWNCGAFRAQSLKGWIMLSTG